MGDYGISNNTWSHFSSEFRPERYVLTEYSYTLDPRFVGTLIGSKSPMFCERAVRFCQNWTMWPAWSYIVQTVVQATSPSLFLFKIDWLSHDARAGTIYFRKDREVFGESLNDTLICDLAEYWRGPSPKELGQLLGQDAPRVTSVRIHNGDSIPITLYYYVKSLPRDLLKAGVASVSDMLEITTVDRTWFRWCLDWLLDVGRPECVGVSFPERQLKISFEKIMTEDFLVFLAEMGVAYKQIERFRRVASDFAQSQLSYVGLKCAGTGAMEWKAYFSISERDGQRYGKHPVDE
jgi:hypothetical protein